MHYSHYRSATVTITHHATVVALGAWIGRVIDLQIHDHAGWALVLGTVSDDVKRWVRAEKLLRSNALDGMLTLLEHREGYRALSHAVREEFETRIGPMQLDEHRTVDDYRTEHVMDNMLLAMATLTNRQRRAVAGAAHAAANQLCLGDGRGAAIKAPWEALREELAMGLEDGVGLAATTGPEKP